jgi:hypothetical protein
MTMQIGRYARTASGGTALIAALALTALSVWAGLKLPLIAGAVLALLVGLLVPGAALLPGSIIATSGGLQTSFVGPLIAADLVMIFWLSRTLGVGPNTRLRSGTRGPIVVLVTFLGWAIFTSGLSGESITPLLRISLYAAILIQLSKAWTNARVLYAVVMAFALINVVGGVAQGQSRLVGLYVGDPAQMGALILAGLIPMVAKELRFPGWWIASGVLVAGLWLTQTRIVWFATIVATTAFIMSRRITRFRRGAVLLILGVGALIGFKVVGEVTFRLGLNADSADYRLDNIAAGLRSGLAHPLTGAGWANPVAVDNLGQVHQGTSTALPYNLFVNVFAATGFPGVILLSLFLWMLLGRLVVRADAPFMFVVVFLAMSLTEMPLFAGSLLTVLFFVYAGLGLSRVGSVSDLNSGVHEPHRRRRSLSHYPPKCRSDLTCISRRSACP